MIFIFVRSFPIFFSPFFLYLILNEYTKSPDWFVNSSNLGIFLVLFSLILIFLPLFFITKGIQNNNINFSYIPKLLFVSAIFYFLNLNFFNFNLRKFADLNNFSNFYQFIYIFNLLIMIKYNEFKKRNNFRGLILLLINSILISVSGSKGTFLVILLLYLFNNKFSLFKKIFFIVLLSIITIKFYPIILFRYLDVGLSAISIAYICEITQISPFTFHLNVIMNYIDGVANIPAITSFFTNSGYSLGYNVSPTIYGEMACIAHVYGYIFYFICY